MKQFFTRLGQIIFYSAIITGAIFSTIRPIEYVENLMGFFTFVCMIVLILMSIQGTELIVNGRKFHGIVSVMALISFCATTLLYAATARWVFAIAWTISAWCITNLREKSKKRTMQ